MFPSTIDNQCHTLTQTLQSTHCTAAVWDEIFIVSISFLKVFQTHGDTKILSSSLLGEGSVS